jgi:glycosyltransferase involved in cell wall biosynthesis
MKEWNIGSIPTDIVQQQALRRQSYTGIKAENNQRLSVVFLSCKRFPWLQKTVHHIHTHISKVEFNIKVEYILVDNGSGDGLINWATSTGIFNKIIINEQNEGIAQGYNRGFSAATGEFILQLGDDEICSTQEPFVRMSMDILGEHEDIGIVRLRNDETEKMIKRQQPVGIPRSTVQGVEFYTLFPVNGLPCAVYAFASSLFKRQAYLYTGNIPIVNRPKESLQRKGRPLHPAHLQEITYAQIFQQYYNGAKIVCIPSVFVHARKNRGPGWRDKR